MSSASQSLSARKRALLLYGGWEGHDPERVADFFEHHHLGEFAVTRSQDLDALATDVLAGFDLLVPIWTFGALTDSQETALLGAVADGLGMVAWHGNASAFLESRSHKFMLGGQFVGHPGGNSVRYPVHFRSMDPLVSGLPDFTVVSEQYYLLVDPAVSVLATTTVDGGELPWLAGIEMPLAWKRRWGRGRVFYCALGHTVGVLEHPQVATLLSRAVTWAARGSTDPY